MKLASIRQASRVALIVELPDGGAALLEDLYRAAALGEAPASLQALIERGDAEVVRLRAALPLHASRLPLVALESVDWLAPQPRTGKILGIAVNNRNLNRVAFREPTHPMIFMKSSTSLTGHQKPIEILQDHGYTIPEPELCAVLGKGGKNIAEKDALSCVFGYTITNDITASGVKFSMDSVALNIGAQNMRPHHTVWREKHGPDDGFLYFTYHTRSKASDTFSPMGPWLTLAADVPDPNKLAVRSWVNGELYTEDSTANYLFPLQRCIAEASRFLTLEAGDIIHFGTAGAGTEKFPMGNRSVNLFEMDGATVDVEFEGLGRLSNVVKRI
ncbi:fumarylacetoacetate hydrolase family protein [Variovorax terrae]|uniref:Fumarylacetoacetate hydrolase family protein n=1 Tax=Variovorax terrae TaxID=2923278 RepID=A0A9X1VZH6_9BURK|nr:fumarylacetoacetate hydrolase family protein [Variovorax terrae]MCJ0765759.1 fumarylacetoacetate hydrolase family protein [Variovorax terrae]